MSFDLLCVLAILVCLVLAPWRLLEELGRGCWHRRCLLGKALRERRKLREAAATCFCGWRCRSSS